MDGAGVPGEYGAERAACPFPERPGGWPLPVPDGCLVASPRVPRPQGLCASSTVPQVALPSYLGALTVISDFQQSHPTHPYFLGSSKFPCALCYSGASSLGISGLFTSDPRCYPGTFATTLSPLIHYPAILDLFSWSFDPQTDCTLCPPSLLVPPSQFLCLP